MALQEEHDPPGVAHQLLLACLDCSKNSKANNDLTEEEAFAYYTNAIGRVKELVALMEARYGKDKVLMVMEFPHSEPVQKLLLKAFPELRCRRIQAHLFERRDRVYYCRGYDPEMAYFKQALDEAIDDAGGDDRCAAEGLKLAAVPVREKSRLYGTRSSKPTRKKAFDEDRGLDPLKAKFPTIYVNGVRIKWGKDESEEMRIPNEAILFIRTYGGAHKYFLPVAENNKGVCDHILGMGVSTVVGTALARGSSGGFARRSDPSARSPSLHLNPSILVGSAVTTSAAAAFAFAPIAACRKDELARRKLITNHKTTLGTQEERGD